ncbi:MAG: methyltransferase regulatory domain-containing protein [Pirellulales bacterium]|nr:methyltransferase regulatory domain-containing protein [Pirellulales bacterium]
MSSHADPDSYDEIPYDSKPFRAMSPDNLAAVAALHGLDPPEVRTCRVLELGCASGGNLLPLAAAFPDARFVGLDLSARQIEMGQATLGAAGLANVELRAASILDLNATLGSFDYIVAHGVYSWVPPAVQQKMFELCRTLLAPQGVACLSYNTYPGWHFRGIIRDLARYHTRRITEPRRRLDEARAFLDFFARSMPDPSTPFAQMVEGEIDLLREAHDAYVFHEHLETFNEPLYFHEFAGRAAEHRLRYVAEARFDERVDDLPEEVRATLAQLSADVIELEQYVDFLLRRTFRETVLAHAAVPVRHPADPERCAKLHFSALVRASHVPVEAASTGIAEFVLAEGVTLSTNDPLAKAALIALVAAAPCSLSFEALGAQVVDQLGEVEQLSPRLGELLLRCIRAKAVMFHGTPFECASRASDRPRASALARHQAAHGERIVTLHHMSADLPPFDRALVALLDGSRERSTLARALVHQIERGELQLQVGGQPLEARDAIERIVAEALEPALAGLAQRALLLA